MCITFYSWQCQILLYCLIPQVSTETKWLDLWLESYSSIERRFCACFRFAVRTRVKTVNVTIQIRVPKLQFHAGGDWCLETRTHSATQRGQAGTPWTTDTFHLQLPSKNKCCALVSSVNCPDDILLTPPALIIGMSGTLEDFCTAGYVQHEVIMHTCNIFYFHMRFKCFLYSLASFFFLAWNARERRKKCFS